MSGAVSPFPIRLFDEQKETYLLITVVLNFSSFQFSFTSFLMFFYVLLTVHLSIILVINQLDAQNLVLK